MTKFIPGGPRRYKHQLDALKKALWCEGTIALLMDPGVGKTAVALDYASILAIKKSVARVLVICPLAAVDTWVLQAEQFVSPQVSFWAEALGGSIPDRLEALVSRGEGGRDKVKKSWALFSRPEVTSPLELPAPALILETINIDTLSSRHSVRGGRGTMADEVYKAVKKYRPDLIIIDESHRIKSNSSNISRLAKRLSRLTPRRMLLTGTVMPHSPLDVFGQWRFMDPNAFPSSFGSFRNRYARMGGWMGQQVIDFRNLDEMQDIMAPRSMVVRKEDALDLPEVTEVIVPVSLSPKESKAYADLKANLATMLVSPDGSTTPASVPNRLSQMMRLRQITSGHMPDDNGTVIEIGTSKVDVISSLITDTLKGERRVVIFCMFTREIAALENKLKKAGERVRVIAGGVKSDERIRIRREFGDLVGHPERIILVAQIKTLSLAVNELVTASYCIFGSLSQQRDDIVQGKDRLHRIGQNRPVTYFYALAPDSVDEVIYKSYLNRTNLETMMLAHIRA